MVVRNKRRAGASGDHRSVHTTGYIGLIRFVGQYADAESGLQYLRARFYDPNTSRFLSRDSFTN